MIYKLKSLATYLVAILVLMVLFPSAKQLEAQTEQLWVFTVVQSNDSYHLVKVFVTDGHSELILSLPKTAQVTLSSLIPSSEINMAQSFFQQNTEAFDNIDITLFLAQQPMVTVRSFAPAPDNESVALNVTYQACASGYYDEVCFGTSQIILISGTTGQQQVLWSLGFHSDQYLPGRSLPVQDVQINDLLWLPDQQALVVAISDEISNRNQGNLSLIVVPTVQGVPSFRIGEGVAWAVAPNSSEMAVISRTAGLSHTLHIISFAPMSGQFSKTSSSLGTYVVFPDFGLAYLQTSLVFLISYDAPSIDNASSLGVFSPARPVPLALFQPEIGGYEKIRSSTTGNVAAIKSSDGLLWKAVISDDVLQIEPLTEHPVTFWQLVKDDILVIQLEGSTSYQVLYLSNIPPTANAGPDQSASASSGDTSLVMLDGSGSSDSDGTIVAYRWYQNDILIAEGVIPQVELGVGVHTITLVVEDDDGATASDEVVITVEAASGCIPVAPADPPTYTVAAGDTAGLIAAISAANANPNPDIIALDAGTYTLTAPNNTLYGKNGLPVINTPITIHGSCATITRDPNAEAFRLFYVSAAGNLTLYDLTLTGGDGGTSNGGAIYSQGTVTATNTTIANSTASGGGAH